MNIRQKIVNDLKVLKIPYKTAGENVSDRCIGIHCPNCGDRGFHMGIFVDKGNASCWVCGARYSYKKIIRALSKKQGVPEQIVNSLLKADLIVYTDVKEERRPRFADGVDDAALKELGVPFPDSFKYILPDSPDEVLDFLEDRDISIATCEEYDIGYCLSGRQHGRIIVPVFYKDILVSYQGRDITNEHPAKYLTAKGPKINHFLFGIDEVEDTAILTEGAFDAIRLGAPAVCTFGTHLTPNQVSLLMERKIKNIIFMWDSDAYLKARTIARSIQPFVDKIKIVRMPNGEDPDSLGKKISLELVSSTAWL